MFATLQWIHTPYILLVYVCVITPSHQGVNIKGAGATFPLDVYTSWIPAYETHRRPFKDVDIHYSSIGSGGGKARIKGVVEPMVDFAGSDSLLSDDDYKNHTDLQMFPTMAGAVVCVFNLPGMPNLNITMPQIVGIYNGSITWWNDSSLAEINPQITLPNHKIIPTARHDKSGTTEIFTRTLSSFDSNWKEKYGTFSLGFDKNDQPYHWNPEVIRVVGLTNRGLSGVILSTRYSIGYLVMSEVTSMKLSYAYLQNSEGNFVAPTISTVQNAMMATSGRFDRTMTASLSNPPGNESYPLAGYTYFIIRMNNMTDCEIAKELVRFIEWFFTNSMAEHYCKDASMVPLPRSLYNIVLADIVHKVTCNDQNVYGLVQEEINQEIESLRTWVTTVYITVPLVGGIIILVIAIFVINKKTKTYRAVWSNEWKIEPLEINFYHVNTQKNSPKIGKFIRLNKNRIHPAVVKSEPVAVSSTSSRLGEWNGNLVYLKALKINLTLTFNKKKTVLWMSRTVQHKNITRFYGLVHLDGIYHSVMHGNSKGSLSQFLHRSNLNASIDLKFAISYELACGMNFLHKNGIIHSYLSSSNCYFDSNWSLKINDWAQNKLEGKTNTRFIFDDLNTINQWDAAEFWMAPERLQFNALPTKSGDVYSFGMIMKEIFTRELPFSEYSSCRTPGEVLRDVMAVALRPGFCLTTPYTARTIMGASWDSDPGVRPSFSVIQEKIMKTYARGNAVVDSIIHLLEEYVYILEETIETVEAREKIVSCGRRSVDRDSFNCPTKEILPASPAHVQPQKYSSVTVVVCNLCDFMSIPSRYGSAQIVEMLMTLFQALDDLTLDNNLYRFDVSSSRYKMVAGLPKPSNNHAQIAVQTAMDLATVARRVLVDSDIYEALSLKVGISSGTVFLGRAGVDSQIETRFLCGDALYIALQMADAAQPKTVLISQTTQELLQPTRKWDVIPRQDTFVWKGALVKTFWVKSNNNLINLTTV